MPRAGLANQTSSSSIGSTPSSGWGRFLLWTGTVTFLMMSAASWKSELSESFFNFFEQASHKGDLVSGLVSETLKEQHGIMKETHLRKAFLLSCRSKRERALQGTFPEERSALGGSQFLKKWLVQEFLQGREISEIRSQLQGMARECAVSRETRATFRRWDEALSRGSRLYQAKSFRLSPSAGHPLSALNIEKLIEGGRSEFFEASGYERIGRTEDGLVNSLIAISLLSQFARAAPLDSRLPEAVYLLGVSYRRLRTLFSDRIGERLLLLCIDYYPGSVWARQASTVWTGARRLGARRG